MSRYRTNILVAAFVAAVAVLTLGRPVAASAATDSPPQQTATQTITVERPQGQIAISDLSFSARGRLQLTVTDTRDWDPGWSVSVTVGAGDPQTKLGWTPSVLDFTPAFTTADGTSYAQQVTAGSSVTPGHDGGAGITDALLGSAPRGHGLGIAVLGAKLTALGHLGDAATVTVTVV